MARARIRMLPYFSVCSGAPSKLRQTGTRNDTMSLATTRACQRPGQPVHAGRSSNRLETSPNEEGKRISIRGQHIGLQFFDSPMLCQADKVQQQK